MDADFNTLYGLASTILQQVEQLPSSAASLDPRLGSVLSAVSTNLPAFQQGLQDAKSFMAVLPQLLGVGQPANYLLEVMDSTELRPGGGFIGNFGALTLSGGRLQGKPQVKDVDLVDNHNCDIGITLPSNLSWFTAGCRTTLQFQDSNLYADFPTNAQRAIDLYNIAGASAFLSNSAGPIKSFQGVIAITPWLIEDMLKITGSVTVQDKDGINVVITSTNLIQEIHYNQLESGQGGSDTSIDPNPSCHGTSYRKCFTASIFYALLAQLGTVSTTNFGALGKLIVNSIHTKDIQIYFAAPGAEALLLHHDLASALNAPKLGDGLMVVDANEGGIKANDQITYTWNDQVSLSSVGNATHHLVLTYFWPDTSYDLDNSYPAHQGQYVYQDYLRIYVPSDAKITSTPDTLVPNGNAPTITTDSTSGMKVVEGLIYEPIGTSFTVSLSWTVPHAAIQTGGGGWLYQYAIEKQAGITWPVNVALTLPSCAHVHGTLRGFTTPTDQTAVYKEQLDTDTNLSLQYSC